MGTSNLVQNFVSGHNPGEKAVKSRVEDAAAFRSEKGKHRHEITRRYCFYGVWRCSCLPIFCFPDAARVEKVSNTDLRLRSIKRSICRFCHLKILQFALAIYIVVMTFTPIGTFGKYGGYVSPSVGNIIDPASQERTEQGLFLSEGVLRAVIACNKFQMLCLSISRMSAFAMYPGTFRCASKNSLLHRASFLTDTQYPT